MSRAARIAPIALALGAAALAGALPSGTASPARKKPPLPAGALTQLAGTAGCVVEVNRSGSKACAGGRGLSGAQAVAVSPDGKNVYVAGEGEDAVAVFSRNRTTGAVTQLTGLNGCVNLPGRTRSCAKGKALDTAAALTVSPDGRNLYVASFFSDGIASFARDPQTGALEQLAGTEGCVTVTGSGGACATGTELWRPTSLTVSADGRNVYVASSISNAVDVFTRDATTGALAQLASPEGCVSESGSHGACVHGRGLLGAEAVAVSPDGTSVYVAAGQGERVATSNVAVFARDPGTGALSQSPTADGCFSADAGDPTCPVARALDTPTSILVSGDGRSVYVGSSAGLAAFARTATTGALQQLAGTDGCVTDHGPQCGHANIFGADSIALSPDGLSVYVASTDSNAVAVFARTKSSGALRQLPAPVGCVSGARANCLHGQALGLAAGVAVSPDGKSVYVASGSAAVAVFARRP